MFKPKKKLPIVLELQRQLDYNKLIDSAFKPSTKSPGKLKENTVPAIMMKYLCT